MNPYLKERYNSEIREKLQKQFGFKSPMEVPTLKKIVVNVGIGKEVEKDKGTKDTVYEEIKQITGQAPVVTKAKIAISNFKIRQNDPVGVKVTLRGDKMWDFAAKLIDIVFPQIKDFRGFTTKAFDGQGNYTVGLEDQTIFFEIDPNRVAKLRGMEITFVTSAKNDEEGKELLVAFGFPYRETVKKKIEKKANKSDKKTSKGKEKSKSKKKAK